MKKAYCIVALLVSVSTFLTGQPVVVNDMGMLHAQQIFDFPHKTAEEIYKQSKLWLNRTYNNPEAVTIGDIANTALKGKGYSECGAIMKGLVPVCFDLSYRFDIDIKDSRARMTINGFEVSSSSQHHTAEVYCVKKDNTIRTNGQASAIVDGYNQISTDLLTTFAQIFDNSASDDW